jgi:hypothetical protein
MRREAIGNALRVMIKQHGLADRNGELVMMGIQNPRSLAEQGTPSEVRSGEISRNDGHHPMAVSGDHHFREFRNFER